MSIRSKAELVCVPPEKVSEVWPYAKEFIRAALDKTKLKRFEDIEPFVLNGQHLLWLAWNGFGIEAAATTEIYHDACVIVACGGVKRARWIDLLQTIEAYAKDNGCRCTRIYGRKGWQRVLPDYASRFVILERPL